MAQVGAGQHAGPRYSARVARMTGSSSMTSTKEVRDAECGVRSAEVPVSAELRRAAPSATGGALFMGSSAPFQRIHIPQSALRTAHCNRQPDAKLGAAGPQALEFHRATVVGDQLAGDEKPQPGAVLLGREIRLKQLARIRGG